MTRRRTTHLALLAAAVLAACGDDAPEPAAEATPAATTAPTADRYCALTRELESAGEKHFARLGRAASPKQYEAAEREFVESQATTIAELSAATPPEIANDVRTLLAAQRERGGLPVGEPVGQKAARAAEKRVLKFEREHC